MDNPGVSLFNNGLSLQLDAVNQQVHCTVPSPLLYIMLQNFENSKAMYMKLSEKGQTSKSEILMSVLDSTLAFFNILQNGFLLDH